VDERIAYANSSISLSFEDDRRFRKDNRRCALMAFPRCATVGDHVVADHGLMYVSVRGDGTAVD